MERIKQYLKLMRIKHYVKNALVFLPLIFSRNIFQWNLTLNAVLGFICFSMVASIVYIINDLNDIELDKKHPVKCKRPLASGKVSKDEAYILIAVLCLIVVIITVLNKFNILSIVILGIYLILNILYSRTLKNKPLIDIVILVFGFLLRVLYGATIIGVTVSNWLYLTIISFSFYLSLGKRRNELAKVGEKEDSKLTRKVLRYYNKDFLDKNMYMCLALTIVFYSLWCVDPSNATSWLVWTVPLVMIICMKYSLTVEGDSYGDPVDVLLSDKLLIGLVLLYGVIMATILYLLPYKDMVLSWIG